MLDKLLIIIKINIYMLSCMDVFTICGRDSDQQEAGSAAYATAWACGNQGYALEGETLFMSAKAASQRSQSVLGH